MVSVVAASAHWFFVSLSVILSQQAFRSWHVLPVPELSPDDPGVPSDLADDVLAQSGMLHLVAQAKKLRAQAMHALSGTPQASRHAVLSHAHALLHFAYSLQAPPENSPFAKFGP